MAPTASDGTEEHDGRFYRVGRVRACRRRLVARWLLHGAAAVPRWLQFEAGGWWSEGGSGLQQQCECEASWRGMFSSAPLLSACTAAAPSV